MTLCDNCRGQLKITAFWLDIAGRGQAEEFEFETCVKCKIVYVTSSSWKIRDGN